MAAAPHGTVLAAVCVVRAPRMGTVLKVENGLITEEVGLDDGVTALSQLGLITKA